MRHRSFKLASLATLAMLVFAFLFRGVLWQSVSSYEDVRHIPLQSLTNEKLKDKIRTETKGMDEEKVISYCRKLTFDCLSFSMRRAEKDVNKMYPHGKTHCVGYAAFFASICGYAFLANSIDSEIEHIRGRIHILGIDIHAPFRNVASLKDHDYVTIYVRGNNFRVDPSIEDALYLK